MRCPLCQHEHSSEGDRYGCPNCEGVKPAPKTIAQRQAELKVRREAQGMVKRPVWATPEEHERVKQLIVEMRDGL